MTWEEIIQKRREKEAMKKNPFDLKIAANLYPIAIADALKQLTRMERRAVGLYYIEALSIAEVASEMGMSWDGADALIDRGVANVRRFLKGSKYEYKGEAVVELPVLDQDALLDLKDIYMEAAL